MVAYTAVEKIGERAWRWKWTAGTGPYEAWLWGRLIQGNLTATEITLDGVGSDALEPPPLEVIDTGLSETAASSLHPPYVRLQWLGASGVEHYLVEESVAGVWSTVGVVVEDGTGLYSWESGVLVDGSTHAYRVVAVDSRGNRGLEVAATVDVICAPEPPRVQTSYAAGNVTIAARA